MSVLAFTKTLLLAIFFVTTHVRAVSLADLGKNRRSLEADVGLDDDEQWELNQVYLAAKLAYMVRKPGLLASRPWLNETKVFRDDSHPRVVKGVLTRTTERACYVAHLDPLANISPGVGSVFTAAELVGGTTISSLTDSSKTCSVRSLVAFALPYSFDAELLSYEQACVSSGKRLILTGHNAAGSLATLEAVRLEALQPWLITFGAAPPFSEDCPLIAPERNIRIINTEEGLIFSPSPEATEKVISLVYDVVPWAYEIFRDFMFLMYQLTGGTTPPELLAAFDGLPLLKTLFVEQIKPDDLVDAGNIHPPGGVTYLPPFPLRKESSSAYVPDPQGFDDIFSSLFMKPYLVWYKDIVVDPVAVVPTMFIAQDMVKYYYKIRQMWRAGRLGVSMGFEHGTYCGDTKQCINQTTTCSSLPSANPPSTTYCLYNQPSMETMMMFCMSDSDCTEGFCVDNMCSQGMEGDLCFDPSQCVNEICVRGRCSSGVKGQPCDQVTDCNPGFCELRQIYLYPFCWNTDSTIQ